MTAGMHAAIMTAKCMRQTSEARNRIVGYMLPTSCSAAEASMSATVQCRDLNDEHGRHDERGECDEAGGAGLTPPARVLGGRAGASALPASMETSTD